MARQYDFAREYPQILSLSTLYGIDPFFVAAIRATENGSPGREFGVLSESAPNYAAQLRTTCVTVRNELLRWGANGFQYSQRVCYTSGFVKAFGARWAPLLVANDPTQLNANWIHNCTELYFSFVDAGDPVAWQGKQHE